MKRYQPGAYAWRALAMVLVAVTAGSIVRAGDPLSDSLRPLPSLDPAQVVRIQLEALRHNDARDRGIEIAFRFASPGNKRSTGPLHRFVDMIKNGPYALMLRHTDAEYAPLELFERQASQRVTLAAPGEAPVTYVFYLSRQDVDGPLKNCWMTDAVVMVPYPGRQV